MSGTQILMLVAGGLFALLYLSCTIFVIWFLVHVARRIL